MGPTTWRGGGDSPRGRLPLVLIESFVAAGRATSYTGRQIDRAPWVYPAVATADTQPERPAAQGGRSPRVNSSWRREARMGSSQSSERRANRGVLFGVGVSLATLTSMLALGLPAGALAPRTGGFGPHHGSSVASPSTVRSHVVAPLTQANFVVTDLATNQSTVYEWSTVAL